MSEGLSLGDVVNAITALATILGLVYIARQTHDTKRHAMGQTLFELDSQFREFSELDAYLMSIFPDDDRPPEDPDEFRHIWNYMGLFERCLVLIESDLLEMKTFYAFYYSRLYRVVIKDYIRKDIEANPDQHQYFIRLCHAVLAYKSRLGLNYSDEQFAENIKNFKLLEEPVADWRVA